MLKTISLAVLLFAQLTDYVYKRNDGDTSIHVHAGLESWDRINDLGDGPLLWVRVDGREYVIRDAATLARVERIFEASREAKREKRELKERIRPLRRRERDLERSLDRLDQERDRADRRGSAMPDYDARKRTVERERDQVSAQIAELEPQRARAEERAEAAAAEAKRQLGRLVEEAVRKGIAQPQ